MAQIHKSNKASWLKVLVNLIIVRIENFLKYSLPQLLTRHSNWRDNSSNAQSRISLKDFENVLSYGHDRYYFPFDCTGTFGRETVSLMSGEHVKICLYPESSSWESTWYYFTSARVLSSQNTYANCLLQCSPWETQAVLLQHHAIKCINDICWVWSPTVNLSTYDLAWLSVKGRTCTVHGCTH